MKRTFHNRVRWFHDLRHGLVFQDDLAGAFVDERLHVEYLPGIVLGFSGLLFC